jgi:aminoglycoside 6'-N-acetyltransferase I
MDQTITFQRLGPAEVDLLCSVRDGLFDNPVDPVQARAFLANPMNEIVLALDGAEVVGFASGTVLQHPDKPPSMFVNEVGVRDDWLRRGIGKAVTQALIDHARARGCQGIWLGTEPDNVAALALYRSLGGEEMTFVGFGWDDAF